MPDFLVILLKINLVLLLFAIAYYLILRRLTFYVVNRAFLVFGILFSTLYPLIDLTDILQNQNQQLVAFVPELNQKVIAIVPLDFITNYWLWITIFFYAGVAIMTFRLVVQFVSLYRMHKKSSPSAIADFKVRILDEPISPFSFWQTVYINPTLHKERDLQTILKHEQIHVKQWHSLDIILAELSVVFYWFNPGVWLMKRAIKENLEFVTDQKILNKGIDKKAYQYSLLDISNLIPAVEIVNNFNLSDLKKRIKMMNAKRSSKLTLSRYLLLLPVLLLTTLAFTVNKKDIKKYFKPIEQVMDVANLIDSAKEEALVIDTRKVIRREASKTLNGKSILPANYSSDMIVDTALINTDSTNSIIRELSAINVSAVNGSNNSHGVILKVKGLMLVKHDSLRYNTDKIVNNLKTAFAGSEKPAEIIGNGLKTTIILRGYKMATKPIDSLNTPEFYFDSKRITQEELNKLNPETIKSITVTKGIGAGHIRIVGVSEKNI